MEFRISDTFTNSLAKLRGEEQKAVKTTAFDLQLNPANPGLKFHKLDRAKDPAFWSVRVSRDLRMIVHRSTNSLLLCYVDHHDKAYKWAERRKLKTHPRTGAAQLIEIRETVQEIVAPQHINEERQIYFSSSLFAGIDAEELLGYGVPEEWLKDVQQVDEDSLLDLVEHLPGEAAEALLTLATGGNPVMRSAAEVQVDPFAHPDAERRFRIMDDTAALEQAFKYPWAAWTIFLHPTQRDIVEREYNGPVRVSGSAGTGKTIVALHRAVWLAREHTDSRVLLTTLSEPLANALQHQLRILISKEPRLAERIEVKAIKTVGERLYRMIFGEFTEASREVINDCLAEETKKIENFTYKLRFLHSEWAEVVDAWQLDSWESYRDVLRLGRKTRLPEKQRMLLWTIFEQVMLRLKEKALVTHPQMLKKITEHLQFRQGAPFEFIVVDEAQDVSVSQVRFLSALGGNRPNSLFFTGDLGQRIFQIPFSWKSLGVDIRGRSLTLNINYRTSHQIRMQADRLLGPEITDVDGNVVDRRSTISVFNGPAPLIRS